MGAEQSRTNKDEAKLSQNEVQQLLNAQRKMYEKKCEDFIKKAAAESAQQQAPMQHSIPMHQSAAMQQPMPQSMAMQQPMPAQQSMPMQQPMPAQQSMPMQQPLSSQQTTSMQHGMPNNYGAPMNTIQFSMHATQANTSLERQRTPYRYGGDELLNMRENTATSANLYPNLNNPGPSRFPTSMHTFNFQNNNARPTESFVMVNHDGQADRRQPSAPPLSTRDRSASRSRNKNNNISDNLKCSICKDLFGLQIFQCNNGHSMCKKCHERRRPCFTCGGTSTNRRNFDLEKYVGENKVPCPNLKDGCILNIKVADMEFHIKECPFNDLRCPIGCPWNGKLKQLSTHFNSSHPNQSKKGVDTEITLEISKNSSNCYLLLLGPFNFLFHVNVLNKSVYMTAQLIGTKISASKWFYEIHVYNKNESRRKYVFTDVCSSHIEPIDEIFKECRCSLLPPTYADGFANDGKLNYKFFIKKTTKNKSTGDSKKNQNENGK